ncbi:hypothetical protein M5362_21955 [Streptomyces sp. Je 1-79]|uniref:hypothetical protein n=1 Tax=Streptomyces sp. Je 1-79 TaxID=2943847 RepID=UPI0021A2808E|nr:hypothetical protein [Streptomyces sp. Je 1-79]MCT4355809.1 hypothetical protein [Streptomyces sp. Je 1-79]
MSDKGPSVSDEEWAAFVEAARKDGVGSDAVPEPRRRRLRRPDRQERHERQDRFRRQERQERQDRPERREPEGWRTWPARQETNRRGRARRQVKGVVGITLAAGLLLLALRPDLITDRLPEGLGGPGDRTPLAAETARPTQAPPEEAFPDRPTLKEPFKGSPALRWADGAAGIELPRAKAVGGLSQERVAQGLDMARRFLVTANLDPATLRGQRPTEAIELLDPRQKDVHGIVDRALSRPDEKHNPLWLFSRFDPAEVRLVGDVVKTRGRTTFVAGERPGEVLIHADYTFVYPLVKTRPGFDEVARTVVRRQMTFALYDPSRILATPGRLNVLRMEESAGNDDCTRDGTGFLHPEFSEDLAAKPPRTGPEVDPYDRSKDLAEAGEDCHGVVTRT